MALSFGVLYSFRNRLVLSSALATRLHEAGKPDEVVRIVLADYGPDGVVELLGPGEGESVHDAIELRLKGRGFPTFDAALAAGRAWRNHLTIAFAHYLVGIKIGPADDPTTPTYGYGSPYYRTPEVRQRDDPGLLVFEGDSEPGPSNSFGYIRAAYGIDALVTYAVPWVARRAYELGPQQSLAYALVHASSFLDNPEAAFILLVTAIEALLPPREDNPKDIAGVVEALQVVLAEMPCINEDLREGLTRELDDRKFYAIGARGRELVKSLGAERFDGKKPDRYFTWCYDVRSRLVHPGAARPTHYELRRQLPHLRWFVLALLGFEVFGERIPKYWTAETLDGPLR